MVETLHAQAELKTYLVHFRKQWKYLDFCLQELEALADLFGQVNPKDLYLDDPRGSFDPKVNPTTFIRLPSDEVARQIVGRSILIKEIIDVYATAQLKKKPSASRRERSRSLSDEKEEDGVIIKK